MRIDIQPGFEITPQCRTYAEYRFFAAVSRFDGARDDVHVALQERDSGRSYRCTAAVSFAGLGQLHATATADRLPAAIDLAASRLGSSIQRRLRDRHAPHSLAPPASDAKTSEPDKVSK
jgi:ribosome-associated translation inhibitor RaiA